MAVRVLVVLKVAVIFLGASAISHDQAGVRAVPVVGDRKDASSHTQFASIRRFER